MRMTRVGADRPAGQLLRRYWQPVALVEELDDIRPVRPVKLMGQDFVLFRDEQGRYGLLDRDCPHRGADHSRSEEHTSDLQSLMRISYAVFCLKRKNIGRNNV